MTGQSVSVTVMVCMAVSMVVSVLIPLFFFWYFRKKKKADILPFFIGCAVFVLFALVLEQILHTVVLLLSPAGQVIQENTVLLGIYGGLMAGLFEETGRFLAFRTVLKKYCGKDENALMYGAGHGGAESVLLLGVTMISNLVLSVMINSGQTELLLAGLEGETKRQMETALSALSTVAAGDILLSGVERLAAVTLHIALSVLVWFAVKQKGKWYLYPLAILIHALVDFTAVLFKDAMPAALLELLVVVMSAAAAGLAFYMWRKYRRG